VHKNGPHDKRRIISWDRLTFWVSTKKKYICIWVSRREGKRLRVRGEDARGPDDEDEGNENNGGDDGIHK